MAIFMASNLSHHLLGTHNSDHVFCLDWKKKKMKNKRTQENNNNNNKNKTESEKKKFSKNSFMRFIDL